MITDAFDTSSFPPQAFLVLGAALFAWVASLGLSLKLAFKIVGANPGSYFSCLGYALMVPTVTGLIGTVAMATIGHGYGLVGILQLYVQIKIFKAAGDCGGWRAFFASIAHGMLVAIVTIVILLGVMFSGMINPDDFKGPFQEMAKQAQEHRRAAAAGTTGPGSSGSSLPWNQSKTANGATLNPYFQD